MCESVRFESVHNELAEGEGNDFMKLFISGKRENAERVTEATAACNTSHEHIGNTTIKKDVAIVFFKYLHPFCGLVLIYLHQERIYLTKFCWGLGFMFFVPNWVYESCTQLGIQNV